MDYLRPQLKKLERTLFDISRDSCSPPNLRGRAWHGPEVGTSTRSQETRRKNNAPQRAFRVPQLKAVPAPPSGFSLIPLGTNFAGHVSVYKMGASSILPPGSNRGFTLPLTWRS
jgi:hypothetical protein